MSEGERRPGHGPVTAFQPGEAVWVWVLGTWQPGVVLGSTDSGSVLARYRRLDGELDDRAFPPSSVMDAETR
jgi:hypothetical protein